MRPPAAAVVTKVQGGERGHVGEQRYRDVLDAWPLEAIEGKGEPLEHAAVTDRCTQPANVPVAQAARAEVEGAQEHRAQPAAERVLNCRGRVSAGAREQQIHCTRRAFRLGQHIAA